MTTGALGPEKVVIVAVLDHVRSLFGVSARRLERKVAVGAGRFERRVVHADLVQIAPEGSELHLVGAAVLEDLAVDCIVVVACVGFDARGSEVFEGAAVHGIRGCQSDCAVLTTESAHGVGYVVRVADLKDVWSPEVLIAVEGDA